MAIIYAPFTKNESSYEEKKLQLCKVCGNVYESLFVVRYVGSEKNLWCVQQLDVSVSTTWLSSRESQTLTDAAGYLLNNARKNKLWLNNK